jgi:hypothetical protein
MQKLIIISIAFLLTFGLTSFSTLAQPTPEPQAAATNTPNRLYVAMVFGQVHSYVIPTPIIWHTITPRPIPSYTQTVIREGQWHGEAWHPNDGTRYLMDFIVKGSTVTDIHFTTSYPGTDNLGQPCSGVFEKVLLGPLPVQNYSFVYSDSNSTFSGRFTSTYYSGGSYSFHETVVNQCKFSISGSWSAAVGVCGTYPCGSMVPR